MILTCFVALAVLAAIGVRHGSAEDQFVKNIAKGSGVIYGTVQYILNMQDPPEQTETGVLIFSVDDGSILGKVPRPPGFDHITDVFVDGDLMFVLDGGNFSSPISPVDTVVGAFNIANPKLPVLVPWSIGHTVVLPYGVSGISASGGKLVITGGWGETSIFSYTLAGELDKISTRTKLIPSGGIDSDISTCFDVLVDSSASYA